MARTRSIRPVVAQTCDVVQEIELDQLAELDRQFQVGDASPLEVATGLKLEELEISSRSREMNRKRVCPNCGGTHYPYGDRD
jgi:hypothetical protein